MGHSFMLTLDQIFFFYRNRKAFMMGILKRFRQTDGVEDERSSSFKRFKPYNNNKKRK
jgi:hypothetical protein